MVLNCIQTKIIGCDLDYSSGNRDSLKLLNYKLTIFFITTGELRMKSVLTLCAGVLFTSLFGTAFIGSDIVFAEDDKKVDVIKIEKKVSVEKSEKEECEACAKSKDGKCEKCKGKCSKCKACSKCKDGKCKKCKEKCSCPKAKAVENSMHEFMEYVYQPTYKRLKVSMAAEPKDKNGWKAIKADSLSLAESGNLLLIHQPKEDAKSWNEIAVSTRDLGGELYQAARKKDFKGATDKYKAMLLKCNACHKKFAKGKYQLTP